MHVNRGSNDGVSSVIPGKALIDHVSDPRPLVSLIEDDIGIENSNSILPVLTTWKKPLLLPIHTEFLSLDVPLFPFYDDRACPFALSKRFPFTFSVRSKSTSRRADDANDLPRQGDCITPMHLCIVSSYCFALVHIQRHASSIQTRLVSLVSNWNTSRVLTIACLALAARFLHVSFGRNYRQLSRGSRNARGWRASRIRNDSRKFALAENKSFCNSHCGLEGTRIYHVEYVTRTLLT